MWAAKDDDRGRSGSVAVHGYGAFDVGLKLGPSSSKQPQKRAAKQGTKSSPRIGSKGQASQARQDKDKQSKFMLEQQPVDHLLAEAQRSGAVDRMASFGRQARSQKSLEKSPKSNNMDLSIELNAPGMQTQHFIPQVGQDQGQDQTRESSPTRQKKSIDTSSKLNGSEAVKAELGIFTNQVIEGSNVEAEDNQEALPPPAQLDQSMSSRPSASRINIDLIAEVAAHHKDNLALSGGGPFKQRHPQSPHFGAQGSELEDQMQTRNKEQRSRKPKRTSPKDKQ